MARDVTRDASGTPLNSVLHRNTMALQQKKTEEEQAAGFQERLAASISGFAGSMSFVYVHVVILVAWVLDSLGWIPGVASFDPSFVVLATAASVEAIFLSTFILITQNRAAIAADRRADLDVQISLLTEHEVTRILELCAEIASGLEIKDARNPRLKELKEDVAPEQVLDEIEKATKDPVKH